MPLSEFSLETTFLVMDLPIILIHDNGKEFINNAVSELCNDWCIESRRTCNSDLRQMERLNDSTIS